MLLRSFWKTEDFRFESTRVDSKIAPIVPCHQRRGNHSHSTRAVPVLSSPPLSLSLSRFFIPSSRSTLAARRQRIRSRSVVLQNAPRGDVVLVRLYEEVSRENVRSECGGKGGFRCTHVRPGYTHPAAPRLPSLSFPSFFSLPRPRSRSRARFLFLFSVYPFQVGGAANQSFLREHDGRRR